MGSRPSFQLKHRPTVPRGQWTDHIYQCQRNKVAANLSSANSAPHYEKMQTAGLRSGPSAKGEGRFLRVAGWWDVY